MDNNSTQQNKIKAKIALELKIREEERAAARRRHNMEAFLTGSTAVLENQEFVRYLISCFQREQHSDTFILGNIVDALLGVIYRGDEQAREKAVFILFYACEFFLDSNLTPGILCCNFVISQWLQEEEEMLSGFDPILRESNKLLQRLAELGHFDDIADSFVIFDAIHHNELPKSPPFAKMINRHIKAFGNERFFRAVFRRYPESENSKRVVDILLSWFGDACIPALVVKISSCNKSNERTALLEILHSFGDALFEGLMQCLKSRPPASVVKTTISLLAELGNDEHYSIIEGFFSYPDKQVQQEALSSIRQFDKDHQRNRFLHALPLVEETLKLDLLGYLLAQDIYDEDLYNALTLLSSERATFSMNTGIELLTMILAALKHYPTEQTLELLSEMRQDYDHTVGGSHIVMLIDNTLSNIRPQIRHEKQMNNSNTGGRAWDTDTKDSSMKSNATKENELSTQPQTIQIDTIEARALEMIDNEDESGAGKFFYEQALEAIEAKRFDIAAYLKNRLLEVDPFALAEAIQLDDLIKDQNVPTVSGYQEEVWKDLLKVFTEQEFNILYSNSTTESYNKGDTIIESGDLDRCMFLLNSGCISLSCQTAGLERFLRRVNPGIVLGCEHLFDASIWTITLRALTPVQVQVVSQQSWDEIITNAPKIREKLHSYCHQQLNIPKLLVQSGDDRRSAVRYIANIPSLHSIIEPLLSGKKQAFNLTKEKQSAGTLLDLSQGGLAVSMHINNQEQAISMLGKQLLTTLEKTTSLEPMLGLIVGVRLHDPFVHSYIVHIKFAQELEEQEVLSILQNNSNEVK